MVMSEPLQGAGRLIWLRRHRRRALIGRGLSVLLVVFGIAGLALGHHQAGLAVLIIGGVPVLAYLLRSLRCRHWCRPPFRLMR
jgi:hypothetical protein